MYVLLNVTKKNDRDTRNCDLITTENGKRFSKNLRSENRMFWKIDLLQYKRVQKLGTRRLA